MWSTGVCGFGGHWSARVLVPPATEPITPTELLERARLKGSDAEGNPLLVDYIAAARGQVEQDTGCALLTQTIAVGFDGMPVRLPWPPLQAIVRVTAIDADGLSYEVDPLTYQVDTLSMPARVFWARAPGPVTLELLVGWTPATLPPPLKQSVGLLASHYLTYGRDRVAVGAGVAEMPAGYAEAIAPYTQVVLI